MPVGAVVFKQFSDGGVAVESAEAARLPLPEEHRNMQSFVFEHRPRRSFESLGNFCHLFEWT